MLRFWLVWVLTAQTALAFDDGYFYINQQQGNTVSVYSRTDLSLKTTIPSLPGPTGIALSPNHPWLAVTYPEQGIISFFDREKLIPLEHVSIGGSPFGAVFTQKLLFYSDWNGHFVGVIDPSTGKIIKKIPIGKSPAGIINVACHSQIWAANRESNSVTVIDSQKFEVIKTIKVGKAPFALDFDQQYAYVANTQGNSLSIISLEELKEIKRLKVGRMPYGVAVNQKQHKVYVSNQLNNTVTVLDTKNHKQLKTLKTGEYPENISFDEKNNRLFVLNWFDGSLSVFNTLTDKEIKRINVEDGSRAFGQFVAKQPPCSD